MGAHINVRLLLSKRAHFKEIINPTIFPCYNIFPYCEKPMILPSAAEEAISVYPLLIGLWLTFCLIVGTLYRCDLASKLIAQKINIPFNDLEGLLAQKELPFFILGGSYIYHFGKVAINALENFVVKLLDRQLFANCLYFFCLTLS